MVSVVIPTYNRAEMVREAVVSVINQQCDNVEILVVDDGSTDGTEDVLRPFVERSEIRYFHGQRFGKAGAARNFGIAQAHGDFICFLDSDDLLAPGSLARRLDVISRNDAVGMVSSDWYHFSGSLSPNTLIPSWITTEQYIERLPSIFIIEKQAREVLFNTLFVYETITRNFINTSTVIVRKKILDKVGCFDETLKISEDRDLWGRIMTFCPSAYISEPLTFTRRHGANLTMDDLKNNFKMDVTVTERFISSTNRYSLDLCSKEIKKLFFRRLGEFYGNAGYFFYVLGDYCEARQLLDRSIEYAPDNFRNRLLRVSTLLPRTILDSLLELKRRVMRQI